MGCLKQSSTQKRGSFTYLPPPPSKVTCGTFCLLWGGGTWFSPQRTHLEVQPPPPSPAAIPMRQNTREWLWSHKVFFSGDGGSTREPIEIMYLRWRHCWILGQVSVLIKVSYTIFWYFLFPCGNLFYGVFFAKKLVRTPKLSIYI